MDYIISNLFKTIFSTTSNITLNKINVDDKYIKNIEDKIFNVGSGRGVTVNELVSVISEITGQSINPIYTNDNAIYIQKIILDISKIRRATGWSPGTGLLEGITKTWEWIKKENF